MQLVGNKVYKAYMDFPKAKTQSFILFFLFYSL